MVRNDIEIDGADGIVRAHQIELAVPQQVAEIDHAELAERDQAADRLAVLVERIRVLGLEVGAAGIRLAAAGKRRLDRLAAGRHDAPVQSGDRQLVAGFDDGVLGLSVELGVSRLKAGDLLALLAARTVIDEVLDRHALGQLQHPADVIDVIVRRHQVVDLFDANLAEYSHDAVEVARAGVAGVDHHRLAGRRAEERGGAAFDVDHIDVEGLSRAG